MAKKNFKDTFLNIQNEIEENETKETNLSKSEDEELKQTIESKTNIDEKEESIPKTVDNQVVKDVKNEEPEIIKTQEKTVITKEEGELVKIVTTNEIQVQETLNDIVQRRVKEIEKEIKKVKRSGFGTGKKKIGFDDMYAGKTISMNRFLKPLFDEICESASMTKAEIIETILINGIKNTNFNPPDDDEE